MYELYPEQYKTTQGDTWDLISQMFYDTPYKVKELIACNPQHSDVLIFDGNIGLNIPILAKDTSTTLAPWKRGA